MLHHSQLFNSGFNLNSHWFYFLFFAMQTFFIAASYLFDLRLGWSLDGFRVSIIIWDTLFLASHLCFSIFCVKRILLKGCFIFFLGEILWWRSLRG